MLISALLVLIFFIILMVLLMLYWRRVVDRALTAHFRAAEQISSGHMPEQWARQIDRRLSLSRPALLPGSKRSGTELALNKLDKLIQFFENNRFYEDEEAKRMLLEQLNSTYQRWQGMTWEELRQTIVS